MAGDPTSAILGLKRHLKDTRAKANNLADENRRWRGIAQSLRKLAGISDEAFSNLMKAESLVE